MLVQKLHYSASWPCGRASCGATGNAALFLNYRFEMTLWGIPVLTQIHISLSFRDHIPTEHSFQLLRGPKGFCRGVNKASIIWYFKSRKQRRILHLSSQHTVYLNNKPCCVHWALGVLWMIKSVVYTDNGCTLKNKRCCVHRQLSIRWIMKCVVYTDTLVILWIIKTVAYTNNWVYSE